MIIRGEKVELRAIDKSDIDDVLEIHQDIEGMSQLLGNILPVNTKSIEEWINNLYPPGIRTKIYFGIKEKGSSELAGYVSLQNINYVNRTGDFGIILREKFRGKGLTKEAIELFFTYLKQHLNIRKINLKVLASNEVAINLYKKIGFIEEGFMKEQVYINDTYEDLLIMSKFL